jgi:hypothetical protein
MELLSKRKSMQKRLRFFATITATLALVCIFSAVHANVRDYNCPSLVNEIRENAAKDIGIREKTGKNDHPSIAKWNKRVGAPANASYCASWVVNKLLDSGVTSVPISAWSPALFPKNSRVMWSNKLITGFVLEPMDVLGMWFASKKRIAHVGFFFYQVGDHIRSMEANTSTTAISGSAEDRDATNGGGVVYKTRHKRSWFGASRFKDC